MGVRGYFDLLGEKFNFSSSLVDYYMNDYLIFFDCFYVCDIPAMKLLLSDYLRIAILFSVFGVFVTLLLLFLFYEFVPV